MSKSIVAGVAVTTGQVVCGVKNPGFQTITPEVPTLGAIWYHSALRDLPEMCWDAFRTEMKVTYNMTVLYRSMRHDPDVGWGDELELDLEYWEPENPFVDDRSFLLVLAEDEDGPFAVWGLPG